MGLSIQITQSLLLSSLILLSTDGRAAPHERQTIRDPKFVSGHDEHFQSPGFIVICGGALVSTGTDFG
jgi:hypothetical protein